MKQIILLALLLLPAVCASGQVQNIDSLANVLETEQLSPGKQFGIYQEITKFYMTYDVEKGIKYAKDGLRLAEKEKDKKMASLFNNRLGVGYYSKMSLDTAYMYLDKSLALAIEAKDKPAEMSAYGGLGNVFRLKQDYQEALNYYMKTLSVSDVSPGMIHAGTLNNIAVIHRILNNPDRAIDYFGQAIKISDQLNLEEHKMNAVYGLATVYADKDDYPKAEDFFRKALEISRKSGNKPYEIMSTMSLATCFSHDKKYDDALSYAQKGLLLAEEFNNPRHIHGAWGTIADIYREMGRYRECEEMSLKSWAIDSTSVEEAAYTAYTLTIANIYLGQHERAEYFLNIYYDIMKSGNEKSLHNSIANMEIKYETEKKELMIGSLQKERQFYIWLGIAGALFIITLLIVLWQTVKSVKREKQLIATRSVLDGEMKERARLAQDLHDRLSGNLSAVKIELGSHAETLQTVRDKLDNCIKDIRSAAHNLMPTSLQFGMKTALEDFTAQFPNVKFHFFGKEKRVEGRVEFVIYCCANELVNNSVKHSGAKNINMQLVQDEKHVTLTVSDDGCGFDEKTVTKGFGMKSIRDRVASCNGKIDISASPGKGTETTIEIGT